jgi:hypothetical protein
MGVRAARGVNGGAVRRVCAFVWVTTPAFCRPYQGSTRVRDVIQGLRASLRSTLTPGYLIAPLRGTLSRFAARIYFRQQLAPPREPHPSQPRTPVGNHRESFSTIKFRFSTTTFRFSTTRFRLSTTKFRFSTTRFRFATAKFRVSTPRAWPAMTERRFWKYRAWSVNGALIRKYRASSFGLARYP